MECMFHGIFNFFFTDILSGISPEAHSEIPLGFSSDFFSENPSGIPPLGL